MVTNYPALENQNCWSQYLQIKFRCHHVFVYQTLTTGLMVTNYPGLEKLDCRVLSCVDKSSAVVVGTLCVLQA